jgi:tetratricopeptide (TPR) repeat protein
VHRGSRALLTNLFAFGVLPVLLILMLEGIVRLFGGGYDMRPFLTINKDGQQLVVTNERFNYQFFRDWKKPIQDDLSMARAKFPKEKPANTYRIFLFGSSGALGWHFPQYGIGPVLQAMLKERYPHANFEVIVLAWYAVNSHVMLANAQACEEFDPDLYLVYMGNNERSGPFGARSRLGHSGMSADQMQSSIQWLQRLNHSRLWQVMMAWGGEWTGIDSPTDGKLWRQEDIPMADPRMDRIVEMYHRNVEGMVASAQRANAKVLLSTVSSNLRIGDVLESIHRPDLTPDETTRWDAAFARGKELQAEGEHAKAIETFREALTLDPQYAETYFRLGQCLEAIQLHAEAREQFQLASDNSYFFGAITAPMNQRLRDTAAAHPDTVYFTDGEAAMNQASPQGIAGFNVFYDIVHLRFEGNYTLAKAFFETLTPSLPEWISQGATNVSPPTFEEVRNLMGRTREVDLNELRHALDNGMSDGPLTQQYFQPLLQQWQVEVAAP